MKVLKIFLTICVTIYMFSMSFVEVCADEYNLYDVDSYTDVGEGRTSFFKESVSYKVSDVDLIGKTKVGASLYGYDLEQNMEKVLPIINSIKFIDNEIEVIGNVDNRYRNSGFILSGKAFKTKDGTIVCEATDLTNNYEVVFLCLEKTQQYNDYILYRGTPETLRNNIGAYGLKIYLMKKGTRDISIMEDVNVTVHDIENLLSSLEETEYSNLNWFTKCFEPDPKYSDMSEIKGDITHSDYLYVASDYYWFGSVYAKLGVILTATNNTPAVGNYGSTLFTSNLNYRYYIVASNPAYNNPLRADGYFRVKNISVENTIGQGYYLQQIAWNGEGMNSLSYSLSLSAYIGVSGGFGGASISLSPYVVSFTRDNWYNLITNYVSSTSVPRRASTFYTNLVLEKEYHYASFNSFVVSDAYMSDKFKCYQTIWTFDIYKKNLWGYGCDKTGEKLTCTSFFY